MYCRKVPPQHRKLTQKSLPSSSRPLFKDAFKDIAAAFHQPDSTVRPQPVTGRALDPRGSDEEVQREIEAALDIALRETDAQPVFRVSYEKELIRLVMRGEAEPETALMSLFGLFDES